MNRILVTGGGGFIGTRIVEALHDRGVEVRAGIRSWKSAARVGRLPVEIVPCDVMDPGQLASAMSDVSHVVHCARGNERVNVEGTRNVLSTALSHGVERVVHLSTVSVYGPAQGSVDEETPISITGAEYGDSKIEAERLCASYQAQGLSTVILRPTIVYGPFSANWTIEFAQRLRGRWQLPREHCEGICNLVYVDDLVQAVLLSLQHPQADGQTFVVNGPDRPTWWEYFDALSTALMGRRLEGPARRSAELAAAFMTPVKRGAKFALAHFENEIMALYQRSDVAKRAMRGLETRVRSAPSRAEFDLYGRRVDYSGAKAERLLGYRPRYDLRQGVRVSAEWLRHHRYV